MQQVTNLPIVPKLSTFSNGPLGLINEASTSHQATSDSAYMSNTTLHFP